MMLRLFAFVQCYNLDVMASEPVMNVIGTSICFALRGIGF